MAENRTNLNNQLDKPGVGRGYFDQPIAFNTNNLNTVSGGLDNKVLTVSTEGIVSLVASGGTVATASYAISASQAISASYAFTASYATNFTVSGSIRDVDYIDFDTASVITQPVAGRLSWNNTDGTLDLGLKGSNVTLQIGQENVVRVVNKTGANLLEADFFAVRLRTVAEGGAQGQRLAVKLAQGDNDLDSATTIGLVTENITDNQEGFITVFGNVSEINTTGAKSYGGTETWVDGDILYLSPYYPGYLTNVKPIAPNHMVVIGYVVYAHANHGKIFVKVDNGYEIDELHNVRINTGSLTSGNLLVYSSSVWINTNQLTGSYGLTGSLTATSITSSFTGSLIGTASFATSASQAISSSFAASASRAVSSSFSSTASYVNPLQQAVLITGSLNISGNVSPAFYMYRSGSTVLDVQGSQGQLFSIADSLSGSLMSVNDISGLPILEVFSSDTVVMGTYGSPGLTVTGSVVRATGSFSGSFTGSLLGTASYATSASQAISSSRAVSSSYALTSSYVTTLNQDITINGSLNATGSITFDSLNGNNGPVKSLFGALTSVTGYTGIVTINTVPPVNFDIQEGIVVNVF